MQNLVDITRQHLFNSLSVTDFGVYTDSVTSQKQLLLKKKGIHIPYKNEAGVVVGKVEKISPLAWTEKVAIVLLNSNCPCSECDYEYGFEVGRMVKSPGVLNSERYDHFKFFGGRLNNVGCTAGVIDSGYLTTMRDDIIDQITNYQPYSQVGFPQWVSASLAKIVTWNGAHELAINGSEYAAGASRAAFLDLVNADTKTHGVTAYASPVSATAVVLVAAAGVKTMTLAAHGGTIMVVDSNNYIGITGIQEDITFKIRGKSNTITTVTVQAGNFSNFTDDDVFRTFSHLAHNGELANHQRTTKPLESSYTKYVFTWKVEVGDMHSAGGRTTAEQKIELFILTSALSGDKWDASNFMWESTADDGGFSADTTFEELIGLSGATGWKS